MRIRDRMTKDPLPVEPKTSLPDAHRIMRQHNIRKLPVLKEEKLVGIVTYDTVLEASPSPATSLSIQELHYLPAAMKKEYYTPKERGYEKNIKRYLQKLQSLIQNGKPVENSTVEKDR